MKAVLFDYNGTLYSDDDINNEAWIATVNEISGGKINAEEFYIDYIGVRNYPFVEAVFKELGLPLDPEKIICLGNSGGGTATIYAAALEPRIKIAVPSCAVCRYADSIGAMLHCECNFVPHIADDFDMGELCGMVAPRSLIVVNGAEDNIFPLDGAKACVNEGARAYAALGADDKLVHVVGSAGHRFYADDAWPIVHKFLD